MSSIKRTLDFEGSVTVVRRVFSFTIFCKAIEIRVYKKQYQCYNRLTIISFTGLNCTKQENKFFLCM